MKQVSEEFENILNQVIRPATKLYFEVNTDVAEVANPTDYENALLNFDLNVAPRVNASDCTNEHYYAIVGDDVPIDDPNRICAPVRILSWYNEPDKSVPVGVSLFTEAGEEAFIGSDANISENFFVAYKPITMSFVGGYIPEFITIEYYDTVDQQWYSTDTIHNANFDKEVSYVPEDRYFWSPFIRLRLQNDDTNGRYQVNWIRLDEREPISFVDNFISSVSISEDTDLTSQSLPIYEMTVECLDVNGEYSPDTDNWKKFSEGSPCFFKMGFAINGITEYVSLFYGKLTQAPDYENKKIKFKTDVNAVGYWKTIERDSSNNENLNVGDVIDGGEIYVLLNRSPKLFDVIDIFFDEDDKENSLTSYCGIIEEPRKLIANALGGYITFNMNNAILSNTNKIQYKVPVGYLRRYGQIQNSLENQPKVGSISIVRNQNKVSEDYYEIFIGDEMGGITFPANSYHTVESIIPFFAFSKIEVEGTSGLPSGLRYDSCAEALQNDGTTKVFITFENETNEDIVWFGTLGIVKVDSDKFTETEVLDRNASETYTNDNDLVTNSYIVDKIKRVARFVTDTSEHYEVDVVQDFRHEVGDVIRLETERGKFRTCIITGLKFTLPGSKGHITCRKIFSVQDIPEAQPDAVGLEVWLGEKKLIIDGTPVPNYTGDAVVLASFEDVYENKAVLIVMGATRYIYQETPNSTTQYLFNDLTITDNNKHVWEFRTLMADLPSSAHSNASIISLPTDGFAPEYWKPLIWR